MEIRNKIYKFDLDYNETGKYIKKLRKERGWTAEELASKIYCSPKTISSWETGVRLPSLDMLVLLSNIFKVSIHSLLLPLDNCECAYLGYHPESFMGMMSSNVADLIEDDDEKCYKTYVRKEYLLQRLHAGVFNEVDREELKTIFHSMGDSLRDLNINKDIVEPDDSYASVLLKVFKIKIKKSIEGNILFGEILGIKYTEENVYTCAEFILSIFFERLLKDEKFNKTIKSMDVLEKSILFTTFLLVPEIRNNAYINQLYECGGRFIKGILCKEDSTLSGLIKSKAYFNLISYVTYYLYKLNSNKLDEILYFSNEELDNYLCKLITDGELYE